MKREGGALWVRWNPAQHVVWVDDVQEGPHRRG
jgi:hypothetical protein